MIIDLYAQCWNDGWMLPFFFRHYDDLVDRYVIFDDGSEDSTRSLLEAHPRVEVRRFERAVEDSFVLSEQALSNECWKESRGRADWVVVTDVDEFLFHPVWHDYLSSCTQTGITLVPALGFQMISEQLPSANEDLARSYRFGAPWVRMLKPSIFDPDEIDEMNFAPGRHSAAPSGRVTVPPRDEMLLFHYKYLGFHETLERHRMLKTGLGDRDAQRGWGHQYLWSEEEFKVDWDAFMDDAVDVSDSSEMARNPRWQYPIRPWWERYRR